MRRTLSNFRLEYPNYKEAFVTGVLTINHLPLTVNHSNYTWAKLFVDQLASAGLTTVSIAPGSRSTPLTMAFYAHPAIEVHLHLDERCAGFFALGMAIASDTPVALVCTSGTAVVNFLPAITEAKMSQIPLLILTADRPPELRHSGANQTIDQVKIFGDQVLWSVDAALPEATPPGVAMRNYQALAHRAFAKANGLVKGPVHLNFPFRKPLEPNSDEWQVAGGKLQVANKITHHASRITQGTINPTDVQISELVKMINTYPNGLIVCGPRTPEGDFPQAVAALSRQIGYPIVADPISGLRFGEWVKDTAVISGYETFIQGDTSWPNPNVILRFGAVPISKWLNSYLDKVSPKHRIHIRENGVWADDSQRTSYFLQANETAVCRAISQQCVKRENDAWVTAVTQTESRTWHALQQAILQKYFDGAVVADVVDLIPEEATLFMGNSSPIRHLDQYGRSATKPIFAYASRGASGIDGNTSTALGIHAVRKRPLVAVLGDITFYHDLNGLWQIKSPSPQPSPFEGEGANITIVLLNNNGGSIFNRLPIAQFEPPFTDLFLTPPNLEFEPVVRMYGLDYQIATTREQFRQLFADSVQDKTPRVIEVRTDNQEDDTRRCEINKFVLEQLRS